MQNSFIGFELWTTDMDRAMTFYPPLAGYEVKIADVGPDRKYHLLQRDNIPRAGVTKILWDDIKQNWIPYIAVKDVMETIGKAETLGGKLLIGPPPGRLPGQRPPGRPPGGGPKPTPLPSRR
jgi:predicted enzyme related to lactoylglutathione lyase